MGMIRIIEMKIAMQQGPLGGLTGNTTEKLREELIMLEVCGWEQR